jgi:rhamnogalacturonan endolyase
VHKQKPSVKGWAAERAAEKLNRGLIAVPIEGRVYLGWRLLREDPSDAAFNVYRQSGSEIPVKLNKAPVAATTDFIDESPPAEKCNYWVVPVTKGKEGGPSEKASVGSMQEKNGLYYTSIRLRGDYRPGKIAIADLNGDGSYDFVIRQPELSIDPGVGGPDLTGTTYKIEAYLSDGTFLWRKDLGLGIEPGIWWSPMVVYDLDGDGKAEVALKTAPGYLNRVGGRIRTGPEYCSVLDGMTGRELAVTNWLPRDSRLGDYNRINRNQIGIAYLDGKTPCLIVARGTYRLMMAEAYEYTRGRLRKLWYWEGDQEEPVIRGQGAHTMIAADVDGDGREEVILGSCVLDDNGTCLWSTGLGHPDSVFVTDIDPLRPGLEILYGLEVGHETNGICQVDAATGGIIWGIQQRTYHIGGAMTADIDPCMPGLECWGREDSKGGSDARYMFSASGRLMAAGDRVPGTANWVFWDADLLRENVDRGTFDRNDPNIAAPFRSRATQGGDQSQPRRMRTRNAPPRLDPNDPNAVRFRQMMNRPFNIVKYGGKVVTRGIEGRIMAVADILGDWREEIITVLPGELRVYTTTIPAADRRVCLMQDAVYRSMIAGLTSGYAQTPVTGYYLGAPPAASGIE